MQGNQFELGVTRLQDLNRAIQLQPQFAIAPYNRALAYYAGGGRRGYGPRLGLGVRP